MNTGDISVALASHIEPLAAKLIGKAPMSRTRKELRFGGKGSLSVVIFGPKRGRWFDHEAGVGGDALSLVAHLRGCTIGEALHWARAWLGDPSSAAPTQERAPTALAHDDVRWNRYLAVKTWAEAVNPAGTIVEAYLASRALRLPPLGALRFHPRCPCVKNRLPAMVALMTEPTTGEPTGGIHRTFLAADGSGKAPIDRPKATLGPLGIIRLSVDEDVTYGLGISEGIETGLSVLQRGWAPVWACGSTGPMSKLPVLPGIDALTIFADADKNGAGQKAATECAERWTAAGRETQIFMPRGVGNDWNDVLRRVAA